VNSIMSSSGVLAKRPLRRILLIWYLFYFIETQVVAWYGLHT
jgi:hypothetical protein